MLNYDLILTGSEGFLGSKIKEFFTSKGYNLGFLDKKLNHDLEDEKFVKHWFNSNTAPVLINAFGFNDKVMAGKINENYLDLEIQDLKKIFETNVFALFSVCREFVRNRKSGRIINFSTIYSVVSPRLDLYKDGPKNIAYGMSKASVNQLTRNLAILTAPNFSVNTLILGGFLEDQDSEFISRFERNVPMKRLGNPSELFALLDFLSFENCEYITGSQITVDGGWTTW